MEGTSHNHHHHSPTQPAAYPPAYPPSAEHHHHSNPHNRRHRSASYTMHPSPTHEWAVVPPAVPAVTPASRPLLPHSPTRPASSYYDPTSEARATSHERSAATTQWPYAKDPNSLERSPLISTATAFAPLPSSSSHPYPNGRPPSPVTHRRLDQSSPRATTNASYAHSAADSRSPRSTYHDPIRTNGSTNLAITKAENSAAQLPPSIPQPPPPPTPPSQRANPMSMASILSDSTAPPEPSVVLPVPAPVAIAAPPVPLPHPATSASTAAPAENDLMASSHVPEAAAHRKRTRSPSYNSALFAPSSIKQEPTEPGRSAHKSPAALEVVQGKTTPVSSRTSRKQAAPQAPPPVTPSLPPLPTEAGPPGLTVEETEAAFRQIQAQDLSDVEENLPEMAEAKNEWIQRTTKRALESEILEATKRKRRRLDLMQRFHDHFNAAADAERSVYIDKFEQEVADEVRAKEIEEDKERKKDQQRKRRREKAIADEQQKREEALASLASVKDDDEKARIQKEILRYDKKIRDTQSRLQGITPSKETRHASPGANTPTAQSTLRDRDANPTAHTTTSQGRGRDEAREIGEDTPEAATVTPATGSKTGRGGKGGRGGGGAGSGAGTGRARKSKEQKQAEKDNARLAQSYIDLGQDLPHIAPKEEERLASYSQRLNREDSEPLSETGGTGAGGATGAAGTPATSFDLQPTAGLTGMAKFESKGYNQIYEQITRDIARAVPKIGRIKNNSLDTKHSNARKTAQLAAKEARRWQLRTNKSTKDVAARAKRAMREMLGFWKRNERDEREGRKAAEKQELDRARRAEAEREANRQKRKLNFLISQTELYSHFIGKKVKTDEIERHGVDGGDGTTTSGQTLRDDPNASHIINLPDSVAKIGQRVTNFEDLDFDAEDETALQQAAMANAQNAIKEAQDRARAFNKQNGDNSGDEEDGRGRDEGDLANAQANFDEGEMNFQNPTSLQSMDVTQPKLLTCQLKEYQLKGLNWLVNLYEQGINGILADEMGLGKTVQSISVMAYLAEVHDIWGPFLVIAPASTLHNWQQEITRFVPEIKVLPYWGSAKDRKVLRKFWDRKHITYTRDSPFHVLVTSYQLVVQDTAYFQKVKWQYMILDEAQAIKSSQSSRWKSLLGFHCRNRLLLTGTPIQNNMQELWALLHFIMPSLFDSHDEFSEWFSKDIENHAQSNTKLNEDQLRRLHMILKPFMLRRIKKHVQKELGDKIEEDVFCDLTYRQRAYYTNLRNKISIMDLIEKAAVGDDQDTATLMNLVMQFRKVCNHPDLFERAEVWSPFSSAYYAETASFMREGNNVNVAYSVRNTIEFWLPRILGDGAGRLDAPGPDNERAGWRKQWLLQRGTIWDAEHIRRSERANGAFSWLRFVDQCPDDVIRTARQTLLERVVDLAHRPEDRTGTLKVAYDDTDDAANTGYTPVHAMLNIVGRADRRALAAATTEGHLHRLLNISSYATEEQGYRVIEAAYLPAVTAPPVELVCSSQHIIAEKESTFFSIPLRRALYPISPNTERALLQSKLPPSKYPVFNLLPPAASSKQRYTKIQVPSMGRFVTDSGKLAKLDQLLRELKEGGHRVLLYFQMTRMIDLMEEYLTYRNYKYCRLDGSTKLEDRRDTVAAFQSSPEIFVFLLSTRAGGLGINLTSADTVIFYDSDWNPTIDSQAMDRAHRLGQTRQVTVYRLITRGTIEERIRKRALQKEEVQRVVISGQAGGDRVVDFNNRSRENNRTKEMAMWLADDDQAAAIERREAEVLEEEAKQGAANAAAGVKAKKRKAPNPVAAGKKKDLSMDDMYHEGEGKFDDQTSGPGLGSHDVSGAATPIDGSGGPPAKKRKGLSKKAKTVQQRLAVVDGEVG